MNGISLMPSLCFADIKAPHVICNALAISSLLSKTGSADAHGDFTELAELNTSIATELQRCYASGKAGGLYFGSSPLSDLLMAAGSLTSASVSWASEVVPDNRTGV
jgi:hypothetical protein